MAIEESKLQFSSVDIDGVKYQTLLTKKYEQRKNYEEPDPRLVLAFIPGTILEFLVKEDTKVKEGDVVLILEAMKMMNKVIAPSDGKVAYHVSEKDIVKKNQLLFEIKT